MGLGVVAPPACPGLNGVSDRFVMVEGRCQNESGKRQNCRREGRSEDEETWQGRVVRTKLCSCQS